jgi:biopolymer transport protein ExbD
MAIKKRGKAMAEFNMSALTDIIFLLLIFFMLTSGVVSPNALNLQLPGNSKTSIKTNSRTDEVKIEIDGGFFLNGRRTSLLLLENELQKRAGAAPQLYNFVIAPVQGTPVEHVVAVMNIALKLKINGILSSEGKKEVSTPGEFKFDR